MKTRSYATLIGLGAITLLIGLAIVTAPSSAGAGEDPHKQPRVSVDAAKQLLRSAVASVAQSLPAAIDYEGTADRPGVRVYSFQSDGVRGLVDVYDGHIAMLTLPKLATDQRSTMTADQAIAAADGYLDRLNSPRVGMEVTVQQGTGGGFLGFTVIYQRTDGGVILPDYRVLEIDGTDGSLISVVDVRREVGPLQDTRIGQDSAIQIALAATPGTKVANVAQLVTFDATGRQLQVWQVALAPDNPTVPGTVVFVDVQTGLVVTL